MMLILKMLNIRYLLYLEYCGENPGKQKAPRGGIIERLKMEKLPLSAAGLGAYGAYALADDHLQLTHDLAMARSLLRGKKALANVPRLSASAAKAADINVCDLWYGRSTSTVAESLVSADTGVRLTYADVERLSNRVAHWASGPVGSCPATPWHSSWKIDPSSSHAGLDWPR